MTPKEEHTEEECKCLNNLEEICENTRAIRRVVNRILDHLHEYHTEDQDNNSEDYDPDAFSWKDLANNDDM
ncbi:MAG: hypothetical protein NTW55_06270 [Planctomycetota bacterium]|nr:hypothetical protein [Planctomycetota bacterium]